MTNKKEKQTFKRLESQGHTRIPHTILPEIYQFDRTKDQNYPISLTESESESESDQNNKTISLSSYTSSSYSSYTSSSQSSYDTYSDSRSVSDSDSTTNSSSSDSEENLKVQMLKLPPRSHSVNQLSTKIFRKKQRGSSIRKSYSIYGKKQKSRITLIRSKSTDTEPLKNFLEKKRNFVTPLLPFHDVPIKWSSKPQTVLVIKKRRNQFVSSVMKNVLNYLIHDLKINVLIEPPVKEEFPDVPCFKEEQKPYLHKFIDFVISIGGDGTLLWTVYQFNLQPVPPLLSFNMGSLGFLAAFDYRRFKETIQLAIEKKFLITFRSRLLCRVYSAKDEILFETNVLNEVVLDRSGSKFISLLKCYCDDVQFTLLSGDGVMVTTPTGSTAYSLSAGGAITHPSMKAILFTPMCSYSVSARPLIFPDSVTLKIKHPKSAKGSCSATFDGRTWGNLENGGYITIQTSKYPLPFMHISNSVSDWFGAISSILGWNEVIYVPKPYDED
ncbi:nad kinase [Anaeramoeba flamelloides]|uniref:Nad kinase n=1 Tax=Anaeramoeba flamelloides TaxID=1746091 RepID=A0ABQ8YT89_9EUKA|nr:nad kinase [Anaeramoeba flamelloides]